MPNHIAIFASGNGTNAQRICEFFKDSSDTIISLIITNNSSAFVIERARQLNIPCLVLSKSDFVNKDKVLKILNDNKINCLVLAGFLLKIPEYLINAFPKHIINIHPALLPKYGGKGMYGDNVHKAVLLNNEIESGITIHFVNEKYDEGEIIFQAKTSIGPDDTPEILAQKIHLLEHKHFPVVINKLLNHTSVK